MLKEKALDADQLNNINNRLNNLEKQTFQEYLTLIEIMSNATFFGEMKKSNCDFAKDNQCSYFFLKNNANSKLPIVSDCEIEGCVNNPPHGHIELSNLTCALCPHWQNKEQLIPTAAAQLKMSYKNNR